MEIIITKLEFIQNGSLSSYQVNNITSRNKHWKKRLSKVCHILHAATFYMKTSPFIYEEIAVLYLPLVINGFIGKSNIRTNSYDTPAPSFFQLYF